MSSETNYQGQLQRLWPFSDTCPSTRKKILWAECFYITVDNQDIAAKSVGWAGQLTKILQVRWQKCNPQTLDSSDLTCHRGTAQFTFLEQGRYYSLPNVQTPDLCHLSHIPYLYMDHTKAGGKLARKQSFGLRGTRRRILLSFLSELLREVRFS